MWVQVFDYDVPQSDIYFAPLCREDLLFSIEIEPELLLRGLNSWTPPL